MALRQQKDAVQNAALAMSLAAAQTATPFALEYVKKNGGRAARKLKQLTGESLARLYKAAHTPPPVQVVTVRAPSQKKKKRKGPNSSAPSRNQNRSGSVTTIHRKEVVTSLKSSEVGEAIKVFNLSPENHLVFPWLAGIVGNWTQYKFSKINFSFVPTVGQFSTTGAVGSLSMGYDPDATSSNSLLSNKEQILGLQFHSETRLDKEARIGTNAGRLLNWYDVGEIGTDNEQFSDLGVLYTDVSGTALADGTTVGTLWVDYTIQMRIPRINSSGGFLHLYNGSANASASARLNPNGAIYGPTNTMREESVTTDTSMLILHQPGNYFIVVLWNASSISSDPVVTLGTGVTPMTLVNNLQISAMSLSSTTQAMFTLAVSVDLSVAGSGILTFSGLSTMTAGNWDVFVFRVPIGLSSASAEEVIRNICKKLGMVPPRGPVRPDNNLAIRNPRDNAAQASSSSIHEM